MRVSAVVVSHGQAAELATCLAALDPQVDELLVVANVPGSVGEAPSRIRVLERERPYGYAANANAGIAATSGDAVLLANPDTVAGSGAVAALATFMAGRPRCGIAGPQLIFPDGSWQPSRRAFPTVGGTLVRRTPLRWLLRPASRQRSHYLLDERPAEPVQAEWMLGAFLLVRREAFEALGGLDEGFRLYCEDIDLCYRAAKAGWERWYVPQAKVVHVHQAVSDRRLLTRRTWWHWRGIARFVRKHPEALRRR
jgi:N-acetylglucosaminyl-diphospho-decaprenol L-rhamnosyltransferase